MIPASRLRLIFSREGLIVAGGLAALLDDVAMIAKMASSAGSKAVGAAVDDTAVTPRYLQGFSPARELPIIWRIAKGSLINKLVFILPVALLLSQFVPVLLSPLLMLGGMYLSYEGAEKIWEYVSGHHPKAKVPVADKGKKYEDQMVKSAVTTDFILSAEIMVLSLSAIADASFWPRAITLVVVALVITALVYGVVAVLVKLDDIGTHLQEKQDGTAAKFGAFLVEAMPKAMTFLSVVGVIAMLWVGGHILITGTEDLGWHLPTSLAHAVADPMHQVPGIGGVLAWIADTLVSALVALLVGAILVVIVHFLPIKGHQGDENDDSTSAPDKDASHAR